MTVDAVTVWPTGFPGLDGALGVGGWPRGRLVELSGPPGGGKTTVALRTVAAAQAAGATAAWVDADGVFDPARAEALGVRVGELLVAVPDSGEQVLRTVEVLLASRAVDVVVVDSVEGCVPEAERARPLGDPWPGLQTRLMSKALRAWAPVARASAAVVVLVNGAFGAPSAVREVRYHASVRVVVSRAEPAGLRLRVVKNKLAAPFQEVVAASP